MSQPTQNTPAYNMASTLPVNADTRNLPIQMEGEHIWKWASMLGTCPFYQKLGPGGVAAIILTARELKLPPMACLNGLLYNVNGKITMSGQLMNTMIINAGHEAKILELSNEKCTIAFKRKTESESQVYTFTKKDADTAGLTGDNWKKYPRDMLFNRCISAGARKYMPDVIGPYYTHEELRPDYNDPAPENMQEVLPQAECEVTDTKQDICPTGSQKNSEVKAQDISQDIQYQDITNKKDEICLHTEPKIDAMQALKLQEDFMLIDAKCKGAMWAYLGGKYGVDKGKFEDIPESQLTVLKNGIQRNIEFNSKAAK